MKKHSCNTTVVLLQGLQGMCDMELILNHTKYIQHQQHHSTNYHNYVWIWHLKWQQIFQQLEAAYKPGSVFLKAVFFMFFLFLFLLSNLVIYVLLAF